ncbi:MAG: peptidylprolyl isomerase [bacterium]
MTMKFLLFLIFFLGISIDFLIVQAEVVDYIVATVNKEPITFSMLHDFMDAIWIEPSLRPKNLDDALQYLINHKLKLQEARKRGIFVSEEELSKRIAMIAEQFPSPKEFNEVLEKKITREDLQAYVIEDIMVQHMVERTFGLFIKNSDIEGDAIVFFEQNREKFVEPEKLLLGRIILQFSDDESKENAKKMAESILKELKDGSNPSNINENIEYVRTDQLSPIEASAISQLQIGEVSPILELSNGYLIIRLKDRIPSRQMTFNEKKEEIENLLRQQKIDEELKFWLKKQQETADIRINYLKDNTSS